MAKKSNEDEVHGVKPSVLKRLGTGVKEEMDAMNGDSLAAEILAAENIISDTENAKGEDQRLASLKEDVKALNGGYSDVIKAQRAKVTYAVFLLQEQGKV